MLILEPLKGLERQHLGFLESASVVVAVVHPPLRQAVEVARVRLSNLDWILEIPIPDYFPVI